MQNPRAVAFKFPIGGFAGVIRDIHEDIAVRIGPFDLCDHSRQRNGLIRVVFRTK